MKKLLQIINRIKRRVVRHWKIWIFLGICIIAFYIVILRDLLSPTRLSNTAAPQSTQIFDRNNKLLFTIYGQRNQTFVPISEIPKFLQEATIAIEDKDFYRHGAIDIRGIIRSVYVIASKRQLQGGSTITQQLVKNSLLTQERTITRKVKEVILAFATEILYPKDKILEMYLNQSPYGGATWGVEAGSQTYFGKKVSELTLAESALLAGLPESPTTLSPFGAHPELATDKQRNILRKMQEQGLITKQQMEKALQEQIVFKKVSDRIQAPHFVLYVKELMAQKYDPAIIEHGGLRVTTSLDLTIQKFAEDTVASEVAKLKTQKVNNGAALIAHPGTGEILAMVGSKDYFDADIAGNYNVTLAHRQPGSSIKPLNYAVGLIKGLNAATPFIDKPICFPGAVGKQYCPANYDGRFRGLIQFRYALANSINIPAVKILKYNGLESMIATSSAMGISTFTDPDRYGLSLTLGGGEVTMLDMATAYGVFANRGYRIDLHPILKVTDSKGKVLEEYKPPTSPIFGKKVFSSGVAFIISHILQDNGAREAVFGSNSKLRIDKQIVSVKTGTTNDLRDNWTIGYTPSYLTVVWVGNSDNTPMGGLVSGISGAAPIWNTLMTHLLKDKKPEPPKQPAEVIGKVVCSTSGLIPPPDGTPDRCPTRYEYFIKGKEPNRVDPGRQRVFIDKGTSDLAKPGQTDNVEEQDKIVVTDPTGDRYCLDCPHPDPATPTKTP